jgi:CRISPR-associated protein Csm2
MRIDSFYEEGTKNIKSDLLDGIAEKFAEGFVHKNISDDTKSYGVGRTQLRRIFNEVKRFEQKLNEKEETWKENYPYIKMIKSKAFYNIVRASKDETKELYKNLSEFIESGINLIKEEKDFKVFTALFEAVYGFYYEKTKNCERGN